MPQPLTRKPAAVSGFTLTELAIVIVIMALLLGGMLLPLSAQQDLRQTAETTRQLDEIREALIGYAVAKGNFPCPAKSTADGNEDRDPASGLCTGGKRYGLLPWVTLGLQPNDSWGHLFIYSVTPAYANSAPAPLISMTSTPDITIYTRDTAGNLTNLSNNNDIPAVVVSTGKNGNLSWTINQPGQNPDGATPNADEDRNALASGNGKTFVSRPPSGTGSVNGEFDDLVTWISPNVLINRMVAANRLP